MKERERIEALARYAQGKSSSVQSHGSFGILNGSVVSKAAGNGGVYHNGDRINVVGGAVFKNGHYVGRKP